MQLFFYFVIAALLVAATAEQATSDNTLVSSTLAQVRSVPQNLFPGCFVHIFTPMVVTCFFFNADLSARG
jgi:hypothetical protein